MRTFLISKIQKPPKENSSRDYGHFFMKLLLLLSLIAPLVDPQSDPQSLMTKFEKVIAL
jgi:hypothetical protein